MDELPVETRAGVGAIVRNADARVFLHRRRVDGGWAPPSGVVRPGETVLEALRREVAHSTGLEVRVRGLLGVYSAPESQVVEGPGRAPVHYVTSVFDCERERGRPRAADDASAWGWFEPLELPDGLLPYGVTWLHDAFRVHRAPRVR